MIATGALTGSNFSPTLASLWVYVIILSIVIGVALDFADCFTRHGADEG